MATLVLTAVGTAIGGPVGGAIGAFLGRQADTAILGAGSREGPRLRELSVTTSSYGQPVARVFGRVRIGGTIIWSTEIRETSTTQGGGKGRPSTRTFSYSVSFAVALCSSRLERVGRIWADGNLLRGAQGDLKVGGSMRSYLGTGDAVVDPLVAADIGTATPAFRDYAYLVFEDLELGDFGNRIPALTFEVFAPSNGAVALNDLLPSGASEATRVVLDHTRGFTDEGGRIGSSLAAIDQVFPLVCSNTTTGLRLSLLGGATGNAPTLPEQLTDTSGELTNQSSTQRGGTLNQEPWALRYYDQERDYQPSVQRALGKRPPGRENIIEFPATLTSDGAKQIANSSTLRTKWHNEKALWRIGELDTELEPGSIVSLPDTSGFWSINSWEWNDRGVELELERVAPNFSDDLPTDAGRANAPLDLSIPPTDLAVFELPPDDMSDTNTPLMFAAISAQTSGWRGASLFAEQGAVLNEVGVARSERAILGKLMSPLGPSRCEIIEAGAVMEVELTAQDLSFRSTDFEGIASGENRLVVGSEVIQFLQARSLGVGRWSLEGLLRGRAGTEDLAQLGHETDTWVALVDGRLTALEPAQLPFSTLTRIAALGRGDDELVYASLQNAGLSRRPPMPVWPRALLQEDGGLSLCWTRRARGKWRWPDTTGLPLVEEREQYQVGFGPVTAPFVSWFVDSPTHHLDGLQIAALVDDHGSGPVWVRQLGTYSQSQALSLTNLG